jgi:prolipoprotein diacylglyceryltransferase
MRPHVVHWLDGIVPGPIAALLAPSWFTCVGLAGIATLLVMLAIARRHRLDTGVVASIVLWCYVAAVAAGILVPMAIDTAQQLVTTGRVRMRWAGMTSFWGYLAGLVAVAVVCRAHRVALARFADLAVAPLGLALVLARLGCFLAGCDYGKVTSLPWAVRFPSGGPAWHDHVAAGLVASDRTGSLPVHPTQLYEAAIGIAILGVALCLAHHRWSRRADGRLFLVAAALYAFGRIIVEGYRGDAGRGIYLGLSSGQIFSLAVVAAIAFGWLARRRRPLPVIATAVLAIWVVAPRPADAQPRTPVPAPAAPVAQPSQSTTPPAAPPPQSMAPPPPPQAPAAYPPPAPFSPPPVADDTSHGPMLHAGILLGVATPLNRRPEQVATLGGPSFSLGLALARFGVWLDLESFGNSDASHGTVLVSGGLVTPVASRLHVGGRIGLGATLVNFDEPAFRDVAGTTVRFEALVDYRLGESWALWLRPLTIDTLTAADLGGPITTWQMRIGLGYRFAVGRKRAPVQLPSPPPYPGQPPYQPYPAPYPQQPYQPYPQQPYPQQPYPQQPYPQQPYPQQPYPQQPYPQPYPQQPYPQQPDPRQPSPQHPQQPPPSQPSASPQQPTKARPR